MPSGDLKSKWFFTDSRSRERDVRVEMRIRIRAVSGRPVATDGTPVVSEPDPDSGDQLLSIVGLGELMACIHAWGCPVTISPPEGELPWQLELEDGVHERRAA
jgi:hypothetical protein